MDITRLNSLHLEDINNETHPSAFFEGRDYTLLIYRFFKDDEDNLEVESYPFIFMDEKIYQYNRYEQKAILIEDFGKLYNILDLFVDKCMEKVYSHVEKIEILEESIHEDLSAIKNWVVYKKELVRMERILMQAMKIHQYFIAKTPKIKEDNHLFTGFEDIEEHLNRIHRVCGSNILKLDSIYSLYATLSNEKMNTTMYILTIISAIFLPLNLLVGFFGMNTEGMYFSGNANGTFYVTLVLIVLFIALYAYFMKFKK
jgi:magnesium transporter